MWGAEWTGGSLPPASGSSKLCDCEEPPQHVSVTSRVSRGISRFPPSFPKHRAAQKFPLQLLQILWKITEAGFSMTATHPKKKRKKETHYLACNHSLWENKSQWVVLSLSNAQHNEGTEYMPGEFKSEFTSTTLLRNFKIHCKMLPGVFVVFRITLRVSS